LVVEGLVVSKFPTLSVPAELLTALSVLLGYEELVLFWVESFLEFAVEFDDFSSLATCLVLSIELALL
jgi:hypothetical protein